MTLNPPAFLVCEYAVNPLGLDVAQPRLSWRLDAAAVVRDVGQKAYQIRVASTADILATGGADVWDSGRVESDQSVHVLYGGPALRSRQRCYWTVRVWDRGGQSSDYAPAAFWEMGLLSPADWSAQWIGHSLVGGEHTSAPAPFLRKSFAVTKQLVAARLYATALGLYEAHINGQVVGRDVFTPGWTDYRKRVQYQTYDVTALLQQGNNVIGAVLGDGWYCGHVGWGPRQFYGERPKFCAQLILTFSDGGTLTIATDGTWRTAAGPLLEADLLMGESYDARREFPGWDAVGFDDASWQPVCLFSPAPIALVAPPGGGAAAVRRIQEITPPTVVRQSKQSWVYDLGQNMVGRVRLKVCGKKGTTIRLRYAEMLNQDGTLYTANLRTARATDYYTCKGATAQEPEVWEPRFTFHGFRYVEVSGGPTEPLSDAITGIVLHSDTPPTGDFACSDPLLNQLQHNIQWGQKGNFLEAPTDCPQRDERLGWTGDAQVFCRTATHNMNVALFFTKWLQDMEDAQASTGSIPCVCPKPFEENDDGGAGWADAFLICPWTIYQAYGDTRILAKHYPAFQKFAAFLVNTATDYSRGAHTGKAWDGYGDWLALDGGPNNVHGRTPHDLISTAFFAHAMRLMSRIATVLGKQDDAKEYAALFEKVRAAFNQRYITPVGFVHSHTQTAYVLALHFDLLPQELRASAVQALIDDIKKRGDRLSTGFLGTPYINHVLTASGRRDVAYQLLFQKHWPSWLYSVTQGATTIWERWDGWTHDKGFQDAGMNSFNHYAYGAIGHWLYATVAGLDSDPQRPGYKHLIIHPQPPTDGSLTHAQATLNTLYGQAESGWRIEGDTFHLRLVIPPNTTATVHLPSGVDGAALTEAGKPCVRNAPFDIGSGIYTFAGPLPRKPVTG